MHSPASPASPVGSSTKSHESAVRLPGLSVSASKDAAGALHLSIVNLDPAAARPVRIDLKGGAWRKASARMLTAATIDTRIRFEGADPFVPAPLPARLAQGQVALTLPSKSVTLVTVE